MKEKTFETPLGTIHYWRNDVLSSGKTLVFLPGLTADHHLFDRQKKPSISNTFCWYGAHLDMPLSVTSDWIFH